MAEKEMRDPKQKSSKMLHNMYIKFQDVKPTQEAAGSGLNRLYNVLCLL